MTKAIIVPRPKETQFDSFIVEWYGDGNLLTMDQLAEKINRSPAFVRSRLIDNGVVINSARSGGKRLHPKELQRTIFLHDKMGMNPDEIAIILNVTPSSIRRRIRGTGRKLRRTRVSPFAKKGGKIELRPPS